MNVEEARVRLVNAERLIRKTIALCFNTNSTIFKMDMLETLRDPIWQSLIALIAIAVSIYFFVLQRKKKSLSYTVLTETALLTINEAIKSKLQIIYEGRPVQEVHLVVLRVVNDGNISIDVKDFYEPLRFKFGDDANILSAETIDATKTLRPQLSIIENSVKVEPILLNDKDTFKIKILVAQYTKRVEADARIFGVRKIKETKDQSFKLMDWLNLAIAAALASFVTMILSFMGSISDYGFIQLIVIRPYSSLII